VSAKPIGDVERLLGVSVQVRSKRAESNIRRRRQGPTGRGQETVGAAGEATVGAARDATVGVGGEAQAGPPSAAPSPTRRRELDPLQDQALYNCHCGFVFQAPVSTSVACPHCGGAQAW
jgi:hypothetical protein